MIKAIFFDLDGVLTTDSKGSLTMSKNFCKEVPGLSIQEVLDCYREDAELLTSGQKPMREVWKRMCSTFNIPPDDDLLLKVLREVPRNNQMFDLAQALLRRYKLRIITDNSRERMDVLTGEMGLNDLFDPIVVSAVERASKSDGTTTIFDIALERAGSSAEDSLFIDNQEKNLVTPARMGMKTYFHDDRKNDIAALHAALRELGVDM